MSIPYNITMGTGFPLSINPNGANAGSQLILSTISIIGYRQWTWVSYPLTNRSILYNPYTSLFAAPSSLAPGAAVIVCNLPINFNFYRITRGILAMFQIVMFQTISRPSDRSRKPGSI